VLLECIDLRAFASLESQWLHSNLNGDQFTRTSQLREKIALYDANLSLLREISK
jgi:hypothetical protein